MRQRDKRFYKLSIINFDLEGLEKLKKELKKLDKAKISFNPAYYTVYVNSYYCCELSFTTHNKIYRKIGVDDEYSGYSLKLDTKEEIELFISKVLNEVIEELKKEKEELLKELKGDKE